MKLIISSGRLKKVLTVVAGFTGNGTKPILQYANIKSNTDGKIYLYATNGYRLIRYELNGVTFMENTEFKIKPQFILNLLKIYNVGDWTNIVFHCEGKNKIFIDIDNIINIPLPFDPIIKYPKLPEYFEKETTDLKIKVSVSEMFEIFNRLKKIGIDSVNLMQISGDILKIVNKNFDVMEMLLLMQKD